MGIEKINPAELATMKLDAMNEAILKQANKAQEIESIETENVEIDDGVERKDYDTGYTLSYTNENGDTVIETYFYGYAGAEDAQKDVRIFHNDGSQTYINYKPEGNDFEKTIEQISPDGKVITKAAVLKETDYLTKDAKVQVYDMQTNKLIEKYASEDEYMKEHSEINQVRTAEINSVEEDNGVTNSSENVRIKNFTKVAVTKSDAMNDTNYAEGVIEDLWTDLKAENMGDGVYLITKNGTPMGWVREENIDFGTKDTAKSVVVDDTREPEVVTRTRDELLNKDDGIRKLQKAAQEYQKNQNQEKISARDDGFVYNADGTYSETKVAENGLTTTKTYNSDGKPIERYTEYPNGEYAKSTISPVTGSITNTERGTVEKKK